MELLPSPALETILVCLEPHEVFLAAGLVNQHLRSCVTDPYFLCVYCQTFLGIEREFRVSRRAVLTLLRRCVRGHYAKLLRFVGFGTTGGTDEDQYQFWVSNMYLDSEGGYCSRDPKCNINTVGVLEAALPKQTSGLKARTELASKLKNARLLKDIMAEEELARLKVILPYSEQDFFNIWVNYKPYFLAEYRRGEERRVFHDEVEQLWTQVHAQRLDMKAIRRYPENKEILVQEVGLADTDGGSVIFVSKKVVFSRKGHFTCPVETFIVFISDRYVDIEADDFAIYDNLLESTDVDAFVASVPGQGLQVSDLHTSDNTFYRTFRRSSRQLKPLVWGKFLRNGYKLSVSLPHYFAGCYLYTKLINPENRMVEFNDPHDTCNIDVDFVGLKGYVVKCI